ncbi:hypothetical protein R3W88_006439 [Solanum pinnatisectum]|uniref:Uncharacterized protein n=1 Tax=Solanum pinnatisectum TaxID=50273 RepID=A0AAV9KER6_9SOLN|nr:hypothetical protein R3W88_006439 [Solanum pinnatisectum]
MAEQHLNARMVTEEIGVGLRIMPKNGSVRGFVEAEEVEKMVRELMEGEKGEMEAMKEGGSSWSTLDPLVDCCCHVGSFAHLNFQLSKKILFYVIF